MREGEASVEVRVSTSPKRLEGELQYDYCCRRELERHRLAILKLGTVLYSSKVPYKREGKNRKLIKKRHRKAYKKARRTFRLASDA